MNQQAALNAAQDRWDSLLPDEQDDQEIARLEAEIERLILSAEERDDIISESLLRCDSRNAVAEVLGKLVFEAYLKLTEEERDQGIIDLVTLVLIPMAEMAIIDAARKITQKEQSNEPSHD